jgi:hypothetical protein
MARHLLCLNEQCCYLLHENASMGLFCCKRCHWQMRFNEDDILLHGRDGPQRPLPLKSKPSAATLDYDPVAHPPAHGDVMAVKVGDKLVRVRQPDGTGWLLLRKVGGEADGEEGWAPAWVFDKLGSGSNSSSALSSGLKTDPSDDVDNARCGGGDSSGGKRDLSWASMIAAKKRKACLT